MEALFLGILYYSNLLTSLIALPQSKLGPQKRYLFAKITRRNVQVCLTRHMNPGTTCWGTLVAEFARKQVRGSDIQRGRDKQVSITTRNLFVA